MSDFNLNRLQGETKFRHLVRLAVAKLNKEHTLDWLELKDMFNFEHSGESLRKYATGWKFILENDEVEQLNSEEEITYKETTEILANGSHKSDKLIKMTAEQSKDVNYLLESHGFDKEAWELVSARNNIWNVHSKQDGVQTLYSSKITVKPRVNGFDIDRLVEIIGKKVEPIFINKPQNGEKLLEIPLFDMHFGVSDFEFYKSMLNQIADKIQSRKWDTILFIIGQDLLHNDNFKGQTGNGTLIQQCDMVKAWEDADKFYSQLINKAIKQSKNIHIAFSIANHDPSLSFGFVKMLEAKFPQVIFDTSIAHRKYFKWENIFVGFAHGDKSRNRIHENFLTDFGKIMVQCSVIEIHTGHLHYEAAKDKFGVLVRTLSTGAKTDSWHNDEGFVGSHKRFQLFEYSSDSLDATYYVS